MKELEQIQLIKNRSYTACIAEAHKLFFSNLKTIIQKTWIYSLLTAIALALFAFFHIVMVILEENNLFLMVILLQ